MMPAAVPTALLIPRTAARWGAGVISLRMVGVRVKTAAGNAVPAMIKAIVVAAFGAYGVARSASPPRQTDTPQNMPRDARLLAPLFVICCDSHPPAGTTSALTKKGNTVRVPAVVWSNPRP